MVDFTRWYWLVGSDTSQVWASGQAKYVPVNDPDYVAWYEGNRPSEAATMRDLELIFAEQYPRGSLQTYSADVRYRKATGGVVVTGITSVPFASDLPTRNSLANAYEYIKATPGNTVSWKLSDGSFVIMNEAALRDATVAMATFVETCFTCESTTRAAIDAGTITTHDQVDAAYATISNVYP
jgi:hypothetical protein